MNEPVVRNDERAIHIYRSDSSEVVDGDMVNLGEKLTVKLSDSHHQYVFQSSSSAIASFFGGGCKGARTASKDPLLVITKRLLGDENEVAIWAGQLY